MKNLYEDFPESNQIMQHIITTAQVEEQYGNIDFFLTHFCNHLSKNLQLIAANMYDSMKYILPCVIILHKQPHGLRFEFSHFFLPDALALGIDNSAECLPLIMRSIIINEFYRTLDGHKIYGFAILWEGWYRLEQSRPDTTRSPAVMPSVDGNEAVMMNVDFGFAETMLVYRIMGGKVNKDFEKEISGKQGLGASMFRHFEKDPQPVAINNFNGIFKKTIGVFGKKSNSEKTTIVK